MNLDYGWLRRAVALRTALVWFLLGLSIPAVAVASGKRGISLARTQPGYQKVACLAQGLWYYNWSLSPSNVARDMTFFPMVRGQADLDSVLRGRPAKQFDTLLMFNEPNKNKPGSLTATTGDFDRYTAELAPYARTLVSLAPGRAFKPWFADYMATPEANKDLEAIAIHWYGPADFGVFKAYMERAKSTYKKPIWLTEFAVIDGRRVFDHRDAVRFLNQALPYLDNDPMIQRYAWFGWRGKNDRPFKDSSFIDADGHLTIVGDRYLLAALAPQERARRLAQCGVTVGQ